MTTARETGVGKVVDPTKNVLDLVEAGNKYQDDMRQAVASRLDQRIDALTHENDALRLQREGYESRIAVLLSTQTDKNASILASAVERLSNVTNERLSLLERNQYMSAGQAIIRDPAISEALDRVKLGEGRQAGLSMAGAFVIGAAVLLSALIAVVTFAITNAGP